MFMFFRRAGDGSDGGATSIDGVSYHPTLGVN